MHIHVSVRKYACNCIVDIPLAFRRSDGLRGLVGHLIYLCSESMVSKQYNNNNIIMVDEATDGQNARSQYYSTRGEVGGYVQELGSNQGTFFLYESSPVQLPILDIQISS